MSPLRRVLAGTLGIVLLLCGGGVALATWLLGSTVIDTAGAVSFVNPLAVPALAPSTVDGSGRRVFDLTATAGSHDFGAGPVRTWGYNGSYLGPTLRVTRGEQVVVNVHNGLDERTTVHWHGMHLPARMDGGPHQMVPAGASWSPTWRVDQPAATLWYHPHPHGETARQVYRGLAGMLLVDDPGTDNAALPHRYGVDDIPVIVQDKTFDGDRLDEGDRLLGGLGKIGDTIVVNGTLAPYLDVRTEQVRLRLLNASNARSYDFGFADDREFALVGTDGGLLPAPVSSTRVMLAPGDRAEIVLTMRPGEQVVLRSTPPPLELDGLGRRFVGGADTLDVLELRAAGTLAPGTAVPRTLTEVPRLDAAQAAQRRTFRLSDQRINGREMDLRRIDATVVAGTVEVWRLVNVDGSPHSFHVHDVQFQVLAVGGRTPPARYAGWQDTVYLPPQVPVEIAVPFTDYTDPDRPYMIHCHMLRHEDQGMMAQFVVVEPGQPAGTPPAEHQHGG